jgi:type I restriction enzyme S subunit
MLPFIPMALLPSDGVPTTRWEMRSPEDVRSGVPFAEGDVLLAKITPCLENGKLGVARGVPGGWGMTSTEVYALRAEGVTTEFPAAFLCQPSVRQALAAKMQGATGRQRLPKEPLDSLPIPVPPLPEQRAIAAVLRSAQRAQAACERGG